MSRARPGFTLAELLVVLAILGVMAAAAVPALGVLLDREPTAGEAVVGLLRDARARALSTATPVTLTIEPAAGRWVLEPAGGEPVEGVLALRGAELVHARPRIVVRFAATGGASGGVVVVRDRGRATVVRADPWTGEVHVGT